jgi:hypothetical protein
MNAAASSSAFFPLPDDPETEVAELFGGPHDGELVAVTPHTHAVLMPVDEHYDFDPARTERRRIPVYTHVNKPASVTL